MRVALSALLLMLAGAAAAAPPPPPDHATAAIPPFPSPARLPRVEGPRSAPLVVLDAGHGGRDPGSHARDGTREKALTLALARAIRDALLADGHVRVAMTRDDDRSLMLADRREAARALDAALFLSLHCDSTADPAVRGASLYTLAPQASDRAAHAVASRENRADSVNGIDLAPRTSDVSAILTGLARRETRADADAFAAMLGRYLAPLGVLKPDYRRAAALKVLRAPDVPGVLLEAGYLSNPADLRRLRSPAGRRLLARAVAAAIEAYLAGRPR